jgi:hypothetical protein
MGRTMYGSMAGWMVGSVISDGQTNTRIRSMTVLPDIPTGKTVRRTEQNNIEKSR